MKCNRIRNVLLEKKAKRVLLVRIKKKKNNETRGRRKANIEKVSRGLADRSCQKEGNCWKGRIWPEK